MGQPGQPRAASVSDSAHRKTFRFTPQSMYVFVVTEKMSSAFFWHSGILRFASRDCVFRSRSRSCRLHVLAGTGILEEGGAGTRPCGTGRAA